MYTEQQKRALLSDRSSLPHWRARSSDLRAAAGGLWLVLQSLRNDREAAASLGFPPGFSMRIAALPVYDMLCGLALEVGMKAVMLYRGQDVITMHDLNRLANAISFDRTAEQRDLFDFYTGRIEWSGKYPTPRDRKSLAAHDALAGHIDLQIDLLTRAEPLFPGSFVKKIYPTKVTDWQEFHPLWQKIDDLSVSSCA